MIALTDGPRLGQRHVNDVHSDLLQRVDDPRRMEIRERRNGAMGPETRDRNRPNIFTGGGQIRP
jgi:hypothetical protein